MPHHTESAIAWDIPHGSLEIQTGVYNDKIAGEIFDSGEPNFVYEDGELLN